MRTNYRGHVQEPVGLQQHGRSQLSQRGLLHATGLSYAARHVPTAHYERLLQTAQTLSVHGIRADVRPSGGAADWSVPVRL